MGSVPARERSDDEIVAAFFARDEKALEYTLERYGKLVLSLCRAILRSDPDAEECVNDLLLSLWRRIPPDKPENFRAYLCKAARCKALDALEKKRRQKRVPEEMTDAFDDFSEALFTRSAEEEYDAAQLSAVIDRFLAGLKKRERLIFVYRCFFVKTVKEISSILGIGERAVYLSLGKTREKLRAFLEKEGYMV